MDLVSNRQSCSITYCPSLIVQSARIFALPTTSNASASIMADPMSKRAAFRSSALAFQNRYPAIA